MDAASRLLRLLSLLSSAPTWSGAELAARLGTTTRTVRRDVARLRDLGYPVDAAAGTDGGYRLGPGGRLPPLLLDDDEAVAIALGLTVVSATTVAGVQEPAVSALAKLDQVLPAPLRERVRVLHTSTVELQPRPAPSVDADVLMRLATGCRRSEAVRFSYRTHGGDEGERRVEPYRIVHAGHRWYLVARDRDRAAWRTFRIDRVTGPVLTGHRFVLDDPPDAVALVSEGTTVAPWAVKAVLRLHLDPAEAVRRFPPSVGVVAAEGPGRATLTIGADEVSDLVGFVAGLPCDVEVIEPAELREALYEHGRRLADRHR